LDIPAASPRPAAQVNVSTPGAALAGFQVSIIGRFWVSTEGDVRLGLPEAVGPMGDHHHLVVHRRSSHLWRSERIGVDRIVVRITEL
jgi:hypothetical protein